MRPLRHARDLVRRARGAVATVAGAIVEDGKTLLVAAGGSPMYATLLGIRFYAQDAQYITEDGVIAPAADATVRAGDDAMVSFLHSAIAPSPRAR